MYLGLAKKKELLTLDLKQESSSPSLLNPLRTIMKEFSV